MATTGEGGSSQPQLSRRDRAFLGQLPDDFLCLDTPTTAQAYPQPQGEQAGHRSVHTCRADRVFPVFA